MEETKITLESKELGSQEFSIDHAQRIFDYQLRKGKIDWDISDEKFELKDGIIKLRNTANPKEAKKRGLVEESGVPSEQA